MGRKSNKSVNHADEIILAKNIPGVTININKHTVNELIVNRVLKECQTPLFYHKFVIHKARSYERNYILKSIMDFVYPSTLMPVHFSQSQTQSSSCFLARNCLEVIIKIMNQKCQIPHRLDPEKPFNVIILANCIVSEEVPVEDNSKNIQEVIEKRFKKETKMLDLNNFSDDIDLNEYVPLFNQKFFQYIINQGVEMAPEILDLQNNYIRDISSISVLKSCIKVLDLSNNEIEDISVLSGLTEFANLKILSLTGNPMCDIYDSYNYVVDVTRYCPNLEKLDGVDITTPEFQKNFMCTAEAKDLAAHFVQYYFTNYDSSNREALKFIYDPLAIFSVNATIKPNQKNSTTVKINHYGLENPYVVVGIVDIMKLFQEFPESCHDPYPTVCDVNIYTDTHAQLVVCGIFKELSQVLSFNRSFYFKRNGQQFIITNEQLHVSNALDYQVGWSFRFPGDVQLTGTPLPYFYEQYKELEELLRKLTDMNLEYCQKYLVYCNYDLKKALTLFSELHINDEVPQEAFVKESGAVIDKQQSPICVALQKKISKKQNYISLKTIWETLNSERLESSISDPPVIMNPTINKLYKKPIALPANLNISQISTDIAHPSSSFMNTFNKIDIKDKPNLISITRKPLLYVPAETFISTEESKKSFATSSNSKDLRNIKIVEDEAPPDKSHFESSTDKKPSKSSRKSRFDERPDNSSAKTSNKIAFSLKLPPENKKVQDPLQEQAARMAEYKKMALKKIAELKAKTRNNPDTSSASNSQNPSKVKSGQVQPSQFGGPKTTQQSMVYNEVPPPSLYKSKIGSSNNSNKRAHTSVNLPSQPAKKPKITVEVPPPNPVLSSKALKQIQATIEFRLQAMKNASIPIQEKNEQQNITSPSIDANIQSGTTNEQILNNDDISKIRQNLQTSPSIDANTQSRKTNEQILNNDDISKIRQNLQKEKEKLVLLKNQFDATINSVSSSKSKPNAIPSASSTTSIGYLANSDDISKQEVIKDMRQKLQEQKEKLMEIKKHLDTTISSKNSKPSTTPTPPQKSKDSNKSIKSTPLKAVPDKIEQNSGPSVASTSSVPTLASSDDIVKKNLTQTEQTVRWKEQKEKLMDEKHLDTPISSKNSKPSTTPTPPQNSKDSNKSIKSTPLKAVPDKIEQNSGPSTASTSSVPTLASSDDIVEQNLTQKEQAMSVDEIVEAVSKKGKWDDRLKRSLQALRPPDKPCGRIRRRIFGTDGRRVQVWLPPIIVLTEEKKEDLQLSDKLGQPSVDSTCSTAVQSSNLKEVENVNQSEQDENQISVNLEGKSENSASVPLDIDDSGTSKDITIKEGENVTVTCSATEHPEPRILCRGEDEGHLIPQTGPHGAQEGIDETNAKKDELNVTSVKRKRKRPGRKERMALKLMWEALRKSTENVSVTEETKETTTNTGQNLQLMWIEGLRESTENVSVTEENKETTTNTGQNLQLMKQTLERSTENVCVSEEDKETITNSGQNLQLTRLKHPEDPNSVIALDQSTENVSVTEDDKETTTNSGQNLQDENQISVNLERKSENSASVPPDIDDSGTSKDITIKEGENVTLICSATGHPEPRILCRGEEEEHLITQTGPQGAQKGIDETNAEKDEFDLTSVKRKRKRPSKKERMARKLMWEALRKSTENVSVTEETKETTTNIGQNLQLMKQALEKSTENVSVTEEDKDTTTNSGQNLQLTRLKHPEDPNSVIALEKSTENVSVTEDDKETTTNSGQNLKDENQISVNLERKSENSASVPQGIDVSGTSKDVTIKEGENVTLICSATGHPEPRILCRGEDGGHLITQTGPHEAQKGIDETNAKKDEFHLTSVKRKRTRPCKKIRMARRLMWEALRKSTENVSVTEETKETTTNTGQNLQLMKQALEKSTENVSVTEEDKETITNSGQNLQLTRLKHPEDPNSVIALDKSTENVSVREDDKETTTNSGQNLKDENQISVNLERKSENSASVPPNIDDSGTSKDITIKEGENVTLICSATGHPEPRILCRGEDEGHLITQTGPHEAQKGIDETNGKKDEFNVTSVKRKRKHLCKKKRMARKLMKQALEKSTENVSVTEEDKDTTTNSGQNLQDENQISVNLECKSENSASVPQDIDDSGTSKDITIKEGENVTLICSATGHPEPRILCRGEDEGHLITQTGPHEAQKGIDETNAKKDEFNVTSVKRKRKNLGKTKRMARKLMKQALEKQALEKSTKNVSVTEEDKETTTNSGQNLQDENQISVNLERKSENSASVPQDIDDSGTSKDITIKEGENVTLICSATGHPEPRILCRGEDEGHLITQTGPHEAQKGIDETNANIDKFNLTSVKRKRKNLNKKRRMAIKLMKQALEKQALEKSTENVPVTEEDKETTTNSGQNLKLMRLKQQEEDKGTSGFNDQTKLDVLSNVNKTPNFSKKLHISITRLPEKESLLSAVNNPSQDSNLKILHGIKSNIEIRLTTFEQITEKCSRTDKEKESKNSNEETLQGQRNEIENASIVQVDAEKHVGAEKHSNYVIENQPKNSLQIEENNSKRKPEKIQQPSDKKCVETQSQNLNTEILHKEKSNIQPKCKNTEPSQPSIKILQTIESDNGIKSEINEIVKNVKLKEINSDESIKTLQKKLDSNNESKSQTSEVFKNIKFEETSLASEGITKFSITNTIDIQNIKEENVPSTIVLKTIANIKQEIPSTVKEQYFSNSNQSTSTAVTISFQGNKKPVDIKPGTPIQGTSTTKDRKSDIQLEKNPQDIKKVGSSETSIKKEQVKTEIATIENKPVMKEISFRNVCPSSSSDDDDDILPLKLFD